MERSTFSLLFYVKKTKLLRSGMAPVYLKITVNGKSAEISLKRGIDPKLWDSNKNKAKGNSEESRSLNEYLLSVQGQIYNYYKDLQDQKKAVTAKALRDAFLGINKKTYFLLELFQTHNDQMEKLIPAEYSPVTLQKFKTSKNHLTEFIKSYYIQKDISVQDVNHEFITAFEFYLMSELKCQNNSAMKHIKALKKIIRIALVNGYLTKDPFANYKIRIKTIEKEYLTDVELEQIIQKDISNNRLSLIRDLFIFQCFTGLAYTDLKDLTTDNIENGDEGHKWLKMKRGKTGVLFKVPLFPAAENILNNYIPFELGDKKIFKVPTNQKMNAYLKEIGDICGINKNLHTHLARHTFATTVTLSKGVPLDTVSKLLGHTKIQTTQIYAKILDEKIFMDTEKARMKYISSK